MSFRSKIYLDHLEKREFISWLKENKAITIEEIKQKKISPSTLKKLTEEKLIFLSSLPENSYHFKDKISLAEKPQNLYPEQQKALKSISMEGFNAYLLFGETGSGKTEVYLQAIEKIAFSGKQALVLIPEISLTPQTLSRFQNRFDTLIVVLHSKLTDKERAFAWNMARMGKAPIIIGTRSAIFTPLKFPGLIIIDEEHDSSYKQQEGYRYSARDLGVIRAQKESIPIILGSATPSMESLNNCIENRYTKLILSCRPEKSSRPNWLPVNIRKSQLINGFSQELIKSIKKVLLEGDQVLIFLNRRGFSPTLSCYDCGWISNCPNCEARLTVHKNQADYYVIIANIQFKFRQYALLVIALSLSLLVKEQSVLRIPLKRYFQKYQFCGLTGIQLAIRQLYKMYCLLFTQVNLVY